jgi:FixJ family two-component response regulator
MDFGRVSQKFQLIVKVTIISMICKEKTGKQIAARLYLQRTYRCTTHRRNIFSELEINSIAGLLNFA